MSTPPTDTAQADRQWIKSLVRAVSTQALGNIAVQGIGFLGLPFISRVYDPAAFGVYGMVVALSSIGGMAFFLGMDIGLLASHRRHHAMVYTGLLIGSVVAAAASFVICLFFMGFAAPLACLAFVAVLTQNWALISVQWAVLTEQHRRLSLIRVAQAVSFIVFGVGLAWIWGASAEMLVLAAALSPVPVIVAFFDLAQFTRPRRARIATALKRRWDFFWPAWPGRFVNLFAARAPMMVAPVLFGPESAGLFAMAFRLLEVPSRTVSSAISNVLITRTAKREGAVLPVVLGVLGPLSAITIVVFGGLWMVMPIAIPLLLGAEWGGVVPVAQLLIVAVAIPFAVSPLSGLLVLNGHGKLSFLWQMGFAIAVCGLLATVWLKGISLMVFCGWFSALCLIAYLIYAGLILWSCRLRDQERAV